MPFISGPDGDLKTAFVSDAWLLDQFVGNTLFCWGFGTSGQIGDNTATNKSNPVQTVAQGNNWKQVTCGGEYAAAIKTDGTLWCWGQNTNGQLGDSTQTNRSSPVQTITFGTNWKQVSAGLTHTAATKTDGTLWAWGNNYYGQLGNNTTTHRSSPVQTITFGTNWKQVSASIGADNMTAIKTDGTLWSWGNNYNGTIGDNTRTYRSSPVQIPGTSWDDIAGGNQHIYARKSDGTLWSWGYNSQGQLGQITRAPRSSPVQIPGSTWCNLNAGSNFSMALKC